MEMGYLTADYRGDTPHHTSKLDIENRYVILSNGTSYVRKYIVTPRKRMTKPKAVLDMKRCLPAVLAYVVLRIYGTM
jgi:hypothetical protein